MKELIFNEQELIDQCLKNNRQAQELLFSNHYDDLYTLAMRYLSDHHDTEDAIICSFPLHVQIPAHREDQLTKNKQI